MMEIIGAIGGLVAVVFGTPSIILFLLQRRGANKKLELEGNQVEASVFDTQTKAYQDLLNRANAETTKAQAATTAALAELGEYKAERLELKEKVEKLEKADRSKNRALRITNEKLEKIRELFQAVVTRTGIVLTKEEQAIYDDTVPTVHHLFEVEVTGETIEIDEEESEYDRRNSPGKTA